MILMSTEREDGKKEETKNEQKVKKGYAYFLTAVQLFPACSLFYHYPFF
jgi:hypothetical protein